MKKIILSSIFVAVAVSANAAPFITVGDQLDLFVRGAVIGKWDSNITYTQADKKLNDYSMVLRVGAEADYGRNSKFKANVKFYEDFTRYLSYSRFNSNLAHVVANASYSEEHWNVKGLFSFDQNFQNSNTTIQAGELVRFNTWRAELMGDYDFTEKMTFEIGGKWNRNEYLGKWHSLYSDYDIYSIPVSLLYRVTPKISAGITYQYRQTQFSGGDTVSTQLYGDSRTDHFVGLTIRGELAPKLTATAYVGGSFRSSHGGIINTGTDTTLALNFSLGYELTEKVGLFATAFRDFGSGASRQSLINTGCELGANYIMNEFIRATTSFTYQNSDFSGTPRSDDEYTFRVGLTYTPNKFLTFGANYRFLENCSNVATARYNQHLVDISASVKY